MSVPIATRLENLYMQASRSDSLEAENRRLAALVDDLTAENRSLLTKIDWLKAGFDRYKGIEREAMLR